jgi:excinuclease UvrABC nuclease subunit
VPNSFDAQTIANQRNNQFAVYGLAARNQFGGLTVVYVGKSKTLRDRLSYWLNNPPGRGITYFYSQAYSTAAAMESAEEQLIQELKPIYNTLLK